MQPPNRPNQVSAADVQRLANIHYFRSGVFQHTEWMGVRTAKCPMDMWVYQELMVRTRTDLVIETGTWEGGSALFFAHMLDQLGEGRVLSVDLQLPESLPKHPRIEYLKGSSISDAVVEQVRQAARAARSVMVILDADHKAAYKLQELKVYEEFVTTGNYLIAEDSTFDYFPAWPEFGPGPAQAVKDFMQDNPRFTVDRAQERHMLTFCPAGFLRKL